EAGWVPVLVTTDDSGEIADAVQRIHDSFHAAETLVGNGHTRKVVTDGGQPICGTLGCDNEAVVDGYCRECADISPGILEEDDDGDEAGAEAEAEAEHEPDKSEDSGSHSPAGGGSDAAN